MIEKIIDCFNADKVYYTQHARREMEEEEFGIIYDGEIIEEYLEDQP